MKKSFFEENSSENFFLIKSKVKFLIFWEKPAEKHVFFCLKNASKKESCESLTKVWRKFHWNCRWPSESFSETFGETFAGHTKVSWNFHWNFQCKLSGGYESLTANFQSNFHTTLKLAWFSHQKSWIFSSNTPASIWPTPFFSHGRGLCRVWLKTYI